MRDKGLIKRVIQQQPGAFDEFYYAYVDRVHRHLFTIVGPDGDLDDLVQQTFVQVYKNIKNFRAESSFSTWLHRVTVNVALQHLRKRSRWYRWESPELSIPLREASAPEQPDEAFGRNEKLRLLHHVLNRLKPKKRIAFVLYEIEGFTLEEISDLVDASVNTVAGRLRAARLEVRKALERKMKSTREAVA